MDRGGFPEVVGPHLDALARPPDVGIPDIHRWAADHSSGVAVGWGLGLMGVSCLWISRAGAWWYHG